MPTSQHPFRFRQKDVPTQAQVQESLKKELGDVNYESHAAVKLESQPDANGKYEWAVIASYTR